jgi:hypothetical protein
LLLRVFVDQNDTAAPGEVSLPQELLLVYLYLQRRAEYLLLSHHFAESVPLPQAPHVAANRHDEVNERVMKVVRAAMQEAQ